MGRESTRQKAGGKTLKRNYRNEHCRLHTAGNEKDAQPKINKIGLFISLRPYFPTCCLLNVGGKEEGSDAGWKRNTFHSNTGV